MASKSNRSPLEVFLFAASNSHAKESMLDNRLLFDLKLAAAERGYFLNAYVPEVDQDGFDIIFDDQDRLSKVQLKTVMKGASTSSWAIHKRLIRPDPYTCENYGFEPSPEGCGYEGGILLMQIDASNSFSIKYFYTDITILCAFRDNLLWAKRPPSKAVIERVFQDLYNGIGNERIKVPKSMFLEASSPDGVLALMGMHNNASTCSWRYHLMNLASPSLPESELAAPIEPLTRSVNDELSKISPRIKSAL